MSVGETVEMSKVSVYPNPNNGAFNVQNVLGAKIELYDFLGKKVLVNNECESDTYRVDGVAKGSYILRVTKGKLQKKYKIIVAE